MLKNAEEAEDMAQEVFIQAFTHWDEFRGDAKTSTWLYRIATNKCLEQLRSSQRLKRSGKMLSIDDKFEVGAGTFCHPGVALEQKERATILFQAIDDLPEKQRIAFLLHKVEALSYEEVGKIMEKSISSVESLMHRAKLSLRENLRSYYEGN